MAGSVRSREGTAQVQAVRGDQERGRFTTNTTVGHCPGGASLVGAVLQEGQLGITLQESSMGTDHKQYTQGMLLAANVGGQHTRQKTWQSL